MGEEKTKIIFLISGLEIGGAEVLLHDILKKIDRDRFETKVVSLAPIGEIGKRMEEDGFDVVSLNVKSKSNFLAPIKLFKLIKKENPDILHTHLFHAHFLGRIVGKMANVPKIISTIHNTDIGGKYGIRETLMKVTRPFRDKDIAVANIVKKRAIEKDFTSEKNSEIIYNGVDFENFPDKDKEEMRKSIGINKDSKMLVTVGNLIEQKGYTYLVDAMEKVVEENKDVKLVIVGEGEKRKELEEKIEKKHLREHIELAGKVPDVNDYLQAADAYVMSSLWEGFPVVLLEACATGLPIVATDVGGNDELIKGDYGTLLEPKDTETLAREINKIIDLSEEEREKLGEKARETIKRNFSIEKMVKDYEKLYNRVNTKDD